MEVSSNSLSSEECQLEDADLTAKPFSREILQQREEEVMPLMDATCEYCGGEFSRKAKGFQRTSIHSKTKKGVSVAGVLQDHFNISVTPGRNTFLCYQCTNLLASLPEKKQAYADVEEKLRKVRLPGTYVAQKILTPGSSKKVVKRRRVSPKIHRVLFSPQKIFHKSSAETQIAVSVNNTPIGRAVVSLSKGKYKTGFRCLFKHSKAARKAAFSVMCDTVRNEVMSCSKELFKSRPVSLENVMGFSWAQYMDQMRNLCPLLVDIIIASLTRKQYHSSVSKKRGSTTISLVPLAGTILSMIMHNKTGRGAVIQKMNSLVMWLGGCKRKVFDAFSKLGWCLGISATRDSIDTFRQEYDQKVLDWRNMITALQIDQKVPAAGVDQPVDAHVIDVPQQMDEEWEEEEDLSEMNSMSSDSTVTSDENTLSDMAETLSSTDSDESSDSSIAVPAPTEPTQSFFFDITFDNVNQKVGVRHHVRGKQNKMFNMVQAYATRDRVPVCGLSNKTPTSDDILNIPDTAYLPSDSDEKDLKLELSYMVARILAAHMVCFAEFDDASQWKILHPYINESSVKSEIVPLGILQFDETKTAEMIHILDNYGRYAPQDKDGKPLPFVLYCDGLSCERADGAQRARINGGDHWARLEMIEPAIQEWHRRLMFVQDTYDELFKFESHREKGTLYNIKQYFDHKGVSGNIMECFNKATELLHFATKGFTVVAAMDLLGVQSVDATPEALPSTASDRRDFLMLLAADIVNMIYEKPNTQEILDSEPAQGGFQYCSCKMDIGGVMVYCSYTKCRKGQWFHIDCLGMSEEEVPEGDWFCSEDCKSLKISGKNKTKGAISDRFRDLKKEYAHRLLWRGLSDLARADAVSENDGMRMIRHWKFDLMEFYEKHHPKYFVYAHRLLTNVAGAVSERLQHQLIWNRTVNIRGGGHNNMPKDLYNEFLNKEYKENSRDAGGQLTDATIARHSQMLGIGKVLSKLYHDEIVCSSVHSYTRRSSTPDDSGDVLKLIELLAPISLFKEEKGRSFKGFESFPAKFSVSHPKGMRERIYRLRKKMANNRKLQMMQDSSSSKILRDVKTSHKELDPLMPDMAGLYGPVDCTEQGCDRKSPDSSAGASMTFQKKDKTCLVCGDKALGYNFNAVSCESCKAFFRRNAHKVIRGRCEGRCDITVESRSFCKKCRLAKCFTVGMRKDMILNDEQKQVRKQKIIINKLRKHGQLPPEDTYAASRQDVNDSLQDRIRSQNLHNLRMSFPNLSDKELDVLMKMKAEPYVEGKDSSSELKYPSWTESQAIVADILANLPEIDQCILNELRIAHEQSSFLANTTTSLKAPPTNATEFVNLAEGFVRRIIKVAKNIEFFKMICKEDQIALLKGSVVEIMMLRSAINYNVETESWSFSTMKCLSKPSGPSTSSESGSKESSNSTDPRNGLFSKGMEAFSGAGQMGGLPKGEEMKRLREMMSSRIKGEEEAKSAMENVSASILKSGGSETYNMFLTYSKFIKSLMRTIHGDLLALKLLIMLSLFSADRQGVLEHDKIQQIQECYAGILQKYVQRRFPDDKIMFAKIVMKLTDLRNINEVHTKMLLKMKVDSIEPLLIEIFDLPNE